MQANRISRTSVRHLRPVETPPVIASDEEVEAVIAEMMQAGAARMRENATNLERRFVGNELARSEAAALRCDANVLLGCARDMAQTHGFELAAVGAAR